MEHSCKKEGCTTPIKPWNKSGYCGPHRRANYLSWYQKQPKAREAKKAWDKRAKAEYDRKRYEADPDYRKSQTQRMRERLGEEAWAKRTARYQRKWRTGITIEVSEALRHIQGGLCAICRRLVDVGSEVPQNRKECADHCHSSGRARGLLCMSCNLCLGHYEKHLKPAGLVLAPFDTYLACPPATLLAAQL